MDGWNKNKGGGGLYLHLGQNVVVRTDTIIGIFDIENTSMSRLTRHYLAPFRRSYPKALFELHESNSYHLLDLLHSNQIDLAVIRTPFAKAGLEMQTLPPEAFLAIGREMIWSHYQECPNALLTDIPPSDTGSVIQSSHPMPASDASEPQKSHTPTSLPLSALTRAPDRKSVV